MIRESSSLGEVEVSECLGTDVSSGVWGQNLQKLMIKQLATNVKFDHNR